MLPKFEEPVNIAIYGLFVCTFLIPQNCLCISFKVSHVCPQELVKASKPNISSAMQNVTMSI